MIYNIKWFLLVQNLSHLQNFVYMLISIFLLFWDKKTKDLVSFYLFNRLFHIFFVLYARVTVGVCNDGVSKVMKAKIVKVRGLMMEA